MTTSDKSRLAVLIDADNVSSSTLTELLEEIANHGIATVKRAYGDWTTQNLVGWKSQLHKHAVQPIQQFAYTSGKNSTDSAFIIDAMDLLYAGNVDGFCIVSSDGDYTRLATRLRESGMTVLGFGEKKTPEAFTAACDKFIFIEVLKPEANVEPGAGHNLPDLESLLRHAITQRLRDDSSWAPLSSVGFFISQNNKSFDSRNYGFRRLSDLVRQQKYIEVKSVEGNDGVGHLYVRLLDESAVSDDTGPGT